MLNQTIPRRENRLYGVWRAMHQRCFDKTSKSYHRYGGRGVTICPAWYKNFNAFEEWALTNGWQQGLQLDKDIKSNMLGISPPVYSPDTCQFITRKHNSLHSSATKFSEEQVVAITAMYESAEDTFQHRRSIAEAFSLTNKQLGCLLARRAYKKLGRGNAGVLTVETKKNILKLRKQGFPFKKVAELTGTNYNTCKAWHAKFIREGTNEL